MVDGALRAIRRWGWQGVGEGGGGDRAQSRADALTTTSNDPEGSNDFVTVFECCRSPAETVRVAVKPFAFPWRSLPPLPPQPAVPPAPAITCPSCSQSHLATPLPRRS